MAIAARSLLGIGSVGLAIACVLGGCDDDSVETPTIEYVVSFNLAATSGPVGALQIEVDYLGINGGWVGAGGTVACRWMVDAALRACNDKRGGALSCAIIDTDGVTGPTALMECSFLSRDAGVRATDFSVTVIDAVAPDLSPIDAEVTVTVTRVPPEATTTTDPDNPAVEYDVVFDMAETTRPVGALQLDITHPGVRGGWLAAGSDVDCQWLLTTEIGVCNEASNRLMKCAAVDTVGFEGPVSLLECGFASPDPVVVPGNFNVDVVDAAATDLSPIVVTVFVTTVTRR